MSDLAPNSLTTSSQEEDHPSFVSVNLQPAMSGYFPTLYCWTQEADYGFYEPYETGMGRYENPEDANREGEEMARRFGVEFHAHTPERAKESEERSKRFRAITQRIIELRRENPGMSLKEAKQIAEKEVGE